MRITLITVAAALMVATPALADDWDFVLTNNSGKSIKTIEISATGANSWVANKVDPEYKKDALLKNSAKMTVHFDKGEGCKYDVKATFEDGTSAIWSGINVCDNAYVTIRYNAAGAPIFTAS